MTCTDIQPLLDDYLDGELDPGATALVREHLSGCPACRAELAGLERLVTEARALPRSVRPARELWSGILPRLGPRPARARPRVRAFLQIAAALLLLVVGAALATWYQRHGAPETAFASERARYTRATAALARTLAANPQALPATTRAVVERNLAIVDQAIREAESALAQDPGNPALEEMVLARYSQRLALLKRAMDAGRVES